MRIDSPIMNNAVITGSFSGSFLGSVTPSAGATIEATTIAFNKITSTPTLVSSSAQIGVGDGALTQNNFTNTLKSKLDAVEASADVTDATNVTAAGALMDSELAEIATVKALTAAGISGSLSAAALVGLGANLVSGSAANVRTFLNVENGATADQSNAEIVAAVEAGTDSNTFTDADHSKLNAIEASADVTDTTNVTSAGALMDSEVSALALIKGLTAAQISGSLSNVAIAALAGGYISASALSSPSQGTIRLASNGVNTDVDSGLQTGDSPTFVGLTLTGDLEVQGTTTTIDSTTVDIGDNIVALNGTGAALGGLHINDANGPKSGSLLWDGTNNKWIGGQSGSEVDVAFLKGQGLVSGSAAQVRTFINVEDNADVTDTTNVTSAGALMDSELSEIATVKALTAAGISGSLSAAALVGLGANLISASAQIGVGDGALTQNNFTNTLKSKLDAIESSATADQTDAQIRTAVEAASDSNVFTDADHTKLNAIEASADVTDTTNVTSAGALMDSELANLAAVKAINQGLTSGSDVRFDSIGVNTAAPGTSGVIRAANDIIAFYSSDERLKDNISNIPNALDKVESLRGVEFDWNDKQEVYEGHDIGVIAQDVEKILPEIVENRDNGYKAVKYEKLTALLIQAVKELSAKVKELESK